MMTTMFGRCCCACAVLIPAADPTAEAAASVVPARRRLRRLTARSFEPVFSGISLLLFMDCSSSNRASERLVLVRAVSVAQEVSHSGIYLARAAVGLRGVRLAVDAGIITDCGGLDRNALRF